MFKRISNERKLPEYARVNFSCYTLVGSDSTQVRGIVPQRVCQQQQSRAVELEMLENVCVLIGLGQLGQLGRASGAERPSLKC
jgi:hypothetical protein